jgi:hypothetical protein
MQRLLRLSGWVVGSSAAALVLWWPAFRSLQATGFGDWQQFHHAWEAGWIALWRFGEWPLWDPFHCGGITIFGNPQSQVFSPFYFLSFLGGPTVGTKLFLVLHAAAGFGGMFAFARQAYGLGRAGSACASAVWAGSGFFAWHGAGGHSAFLPFYFTPLVLFAWRRTADDVRWAAAVAGLFALVLCEGGVYPFPFLVLLCAFDGVARWVRASRAGERWGIARGALVAVPLTALVGAVRLMPILDELRRHPRTMPSVDSLTLLEVLEMLTARSHPWRNPPHPFVWGEYGTFVGWGALALGACGLVVALARRRPSLPVGLVVFGAFMLGDHGPWSPWALLHELPIYDSLRVPSRFAVFFTLYLALLAGTALDAAESGLSWWAVRRFGAWPRLLATAIPHACVLGLCWDLYAVNHVTVARWTRPPVADGPVAARHHLSTLPYGRWYASFPRLNVGSRGCYEAMAFEVPKGLWTGDVPQVRIEARPGATRPGGEVRAWGRTTSTAWAEVALDGPARIVFNQGFAPGWTASVGVAAADPYGRLVVDAPAGTRRILLRYRPPTLAWALGLSLAGAAATLVVGRGRFSLFRVWGEKRISAR